MKRFLLSVVLATTLALTSCQFDDSDIWGKLDEYGQSIKDHEQRISALEELCKQMNTNIEALQTLVGALEKRDYVTNVSEVRSNGEVIGYTISFAYSDTVTIYHGQDGKDGYTPQIGVMKDTDNIYYWTLDGEWLIDAKGNKIKAVGTDGKDGQDGTNGSDGKDGQDGTNGTDGKDGADGKDGVTPQLKIENDYWYVSYDNGATWVQLGKATGEYGKDGQDGNDGADGSDGVDGEDGDSIFKSVTQDDEYVYFNLADGTMITLPKHDKENIQFEDLQVKAICCKNWDTNNDGELSYAEAAAVETIGTAFKGNVNILAFNELKYFTNITEIADGAFDGCTALWKVILPENISIIGRRAFYNCDGIVDIKMHTNVLAINDYAFTECSNLKSVTIGDNITSIGKYAFQHCSALKRVIIPDSVAIIDNGAFGYCKGLEYMNIGNGVAEFGWGVFVSCVGELICNSNVRDLTTQQGSGVFSESLFHKATFGERCTKIGTDAFDEGVVKTVILEKSVTIISGEAFNVSSLDYVYCKSTIPPTMGSSFYSGLEKIYVPIGCGDKYKAASGWKSYASKIEEFDFENNSI